MITPIGRFLRKLRIDRDEILKDMAGKLNVTVSYLSAIENGKRPFPAEWESQLSNLYSLEPDQCTAFKNAILESKKTFELNVETAGKPNRELAYVFARRFKDLDEETITQIRELLGGIENHE